VSEPDAHRPEVISDNDARGVASGRASRKRATLLAVLTSPRAWMRFFRDPRAPKGPKVLAVIALLYVLSPVDLLPEVFVPLVGWLDDLGVATIAASWLASVAVRYENEQAPQAPAHDRAT
jgi:uncharacterized membrane protein YkvA (DUF1232 family)